MIMMNSATVMDIVPMTRKADGVMRIAQTRVTNPPARMSRRS
jgi:hypothetical protein